MPDEFQLHQASKRGDDAKLLLESPLLAEAFAKLKQNYLDQLMATDVTQSDIRDKCYLAARVVDVVRDHLSNVVTNGVVAKHDLQQLAKEAERKKLFG
jgi:hypothetical protein